MTKTILITLIILLTTTSTALANDPPEPPEEGETFDYQGGGGALDEHLTGVTDAIMADMWPYMQKAAFTLFAMLDEVNLLAAVVIVGISLALLFYISRRNMGVNVQNVNVISQNDMREPPGGRYMP